LNLSPFTLDAYEQAIAHEGDEAPFLLAEIHTSLAYNIRQVPNQRNIALSSLYEHQQELYRTRADEADSISDLIDALHEKGNNWERAPLRATNTRDGWEDSMIGLIKDVGVYLQ
jgi:bromodomain adjacent to zinc finger domain protein 1A